MLTGIACDQPHVYVLVVLGDKAPTTASLSLLCCRLTMHLQVECQAGACVAKKCASHKLQHAHLPQWHHAAGSKVVLANVCTTYVSCQIQLCHSTPCQCSATHACMHILLLIPGVDDTAWQTVFSSQQSACLLARPDSQTGASRSVCDQQPQVEHLDDFMACMQASRHFTRREAQDRCTTNLHCRSASF